MELVLQVYAYTHAFQKEEIYGLISQMRRSATSVPSNIAEAKDVPQIGAALFFFCHARGSLLELDTQTLIAQKLEYVATLEAEKLIAIVHNLAAC